MRTIVSAVTIVVLLSSCAPIGLPPAREAGGAALTSFAIVAPPVEGVVDRTRCSVSVQVPWDTDCTGLVAAFTISGQRVTVGGVEQQSGITLNDFSRPVEYMVECADGTRAAYQVSVTVQPRPSQQKSITAFSFVQPPVPAVVDSAQHAISAVVPRGTDRSSLVARYESSGISVCVADTEQQSGVTINDFTDPVEYVVAAEDGSTQTYVVTVLEAPSQEKAITTFTIQAPGTAAAIDEENRIIRVRVAEGTGLASLVAVFTTTGTAVSVGGVAQESGVTANDFTSAVEYEVRAQDGSAAIYSVRVADRLRLVVNEIDADQVGTDNAEFIELYAAGNVDLHGLVLVLINGSLAPGQEYARIDLSSLGEMVPGACVVLAGPLVPVPPPGLKFTPPGWELTNRIQNGPADAVMIWDTIGRRPVDTVTYAGTLHRAVIAGEIVELDPTEGSAGAPADSNSIIGSICRSPNGQDTGQNAADFTFCPTPTPGAPNP
jgi:hypothetical protein